MTRYARNRAMLTSVALLVLAAPAYALDGQDLLTKINAAYAEGSGSLRAASVDVSGDDVTLKGVTFSANSIGAKPVAIGDVELQDVTEEDGGAYTIGRVEFPDINFTDEKVTGSVKDLYMSGLWVPADAKANDISSLMFYDEAHFGQVEVSFEGKPAFSITEGSATMEMNEDETSIGYTADISGIKADLSLIPGPKAQDAVDTLNLKSVDGSIKMVGSWEIPTGTIDLAEYTFDFANVGVLDMSLNISGYTLELMKQLQETSKTMQTQPGNEQAQQAAGLAMLGLAQQLTFNNARITFEDDGITKRGLDYAGKQQNASGEDIAQMVKAMTPLLLAQFKLADLQATVPAAVNAFLDNPGNLNIEMAPEKPVPFPMIIGAGMGAPETLPNLLGLSVTANEE